MAGKNKLPRSVRLASTRALWVLNRAGRLKLVFEDEPLPPITSAEADAGIKRSMRLQEELENR